MASVRSEEHTSELQSLRHLVCRLLLEKKKAGPGWSSSQEIRKPTCWVDCATARKPSRAIFFCNDTATTGIYTLSLHDALPISTAAAALGAEAARGGGVNRPRGPFQIVERSEEHTSELQSLRHLVCRLLLE